MLLKIDKINNKTVKITLNIHDMQKLNITYDEMDYQKPETKKAISQIIKVIKPQIIIDPNESKIFVEAFPNEDGGCFLFVNIVDNKLYHKKSNHSFDTPLIFEFENLDILTDCCVILQNLYNHTIIKSSLYLLYGKYRLLIYTYCKMDDEIINLLKEHCEYISKGAFAAALTMEHSQDIIESNAIEIICNCLK